MRRTLRVLPLMTMACAGPFGSEDTDVELAASVVLFAFPVAEPERIHRLVGVDHDPVAYGDGAQALICEDYLGRGFPHCYDGHGGSDFMLDGAFEAMDADSATVIVAADGVVELARDGHYDRCVGMLDGIDCAGHPVIANAVSVRHADGSLTRYWHLKQDSVLVDVGQAVSRGDALGLIGSSGRSSMPHLHFEVQDSEGRVVDPYADPIVGGTRWCDQGPPDGLPGWCETP